jgi:hypothetical protein
MDKIKEWYYEKFFDYVYLCWYSFKELLWDNVISIFKEIKNPTTWQWMFYILIGYSVWLKRWDVLKILIIPTLLIYLVRQKREGTYNKSKREIALRNDWHYFVLKEYNKYKKECFFKKSEPLTLETWKQKELDKIDNPD